MASVNRLQRAERAARARGRGRSACPSKAAEAVAAAGAELAARFGVDGGLHGELVRLYEVELGADWREGEEARMSSEGQGRMSSEGQGRMRRGGPREDEEGWAKGG